MTVDATRACSCPSMEVGLNASACESAMQAIIGTDLSVLLKSWRRAREACKFQ